MKEFWDNRYAEQGFAYGQSPNQYLQTKLQMPAAKLLLPAEGEGRNAIFAAKAGWEVSAFDISSQAQRKALAWAQAEGLSLDYQVANIREIAYPAAYFDAVGLIYAHLPATERRLLNQKVSSYLKPKGWLILEGFSQRHLDHNRQNPSVGGPKDKDMLYSEEELRADFADFDILELSDQDIELSEGKYHRGLGAVLRLFAQKR